jgi:hypothetical protein
LRVTSYEGSEEQKLLQDVTAAAGSAGLEAVLASTDGGSWRLQMNFRGWVTTQYPARDVTGWIGGDLDRARLMASLVTVGEGPPSEIVQFLLTNFGSDDRVASALYLDFVSGTFWGNESARLSGQIAQLESWVSDRSQSAGVKRWARDVIAGLSGRREAVLVNAGRKLTPFRRAGSRADSIGRRNSGRFMVPDRR